jgi:hypothetical protein
MFRKIVANLSFSPALIGQLSFYAKRLKKEEVTRRTGLVFVALALVVQSFVVFQPPESANAAHPSDMVDGGLGLGSSRSLDKFVLPYDKNTKHLQDIMNRFGITRSEILSAKFSSFTTSSSKLSWGHVARAGSSPVTVNNTAGQNVATVHGTPTHLANGTGKKIYGWIGNSQSMGWFAIMQACGNLVTQGPPPAIPKPPAPTPPTPKAPPAKIELSKTTKNVSQGNIDAQTAVAQANDRISFTISATNSGGTAATVEFKDDLGDTLEYATLVDDGGGTFNEQTKVLSWPDVSIGPGETVSRSFAVSILAVTPTTPQGQSDPNSYDCVIENVFGDSSVSVPVSCAPPKVVEQIVNELPKTGPTENLIFGAALLAVVSYFFFRSRQLGKEVRLIRRDINVGTI